MAVSNYGELTSAAKTEMFKQIRIGLPMMGVNLVQFSLQTVAVLFVGHLGELELSSASIATSICSVTGYSLLLGLASALETLCGQAYGAKQYHLLGIFLQRAIIILNIIALPIALMWFNMEKVLLFFRQSPDISFKAGIYARYLIPALFSYAFLQPLIRFLQTQSIVFPMFIATTITAVIHILFCWIFIYKLGLGNKGAALSVSLSNWLNVVFLLIIVFKTPNCARCWGGFSTAAFRGIKQFLELALPSAVMCCVEWWAFEALILLSGVLPRPELEASVFSILLNIDGVCYMIPWGIGAAASTRVSNELGAGRASAAKFSFNISIILALIDAFSVAIILLISRRGLGKAFSNETEVVNYVYKMIPILACVSIMDAIQGVISGVARGCGWQALAAFVNIGAYYIVGLPIAYVLAFHSGFRGKGLLIGIFCGASTQVIAFSVISIFTNWQKKAEEASNRVDLSSPLLLTDS